jgi:hypothetical protein
MSRFSWKNGQKMANIHVFFFGVQAKFLASRWNDWEQTKFYTVQNNRQKFV